MKNNLALTLLVVALSTALSRAAELRFDPPVPASPELLATTNADEAWKQYTELERESSRNLPRQEPERALARQRMYLKLFGIWWPFTRNTRPPRSAGRR